MIDARELTWGRPGIDGGVLTVRLADGACAGLVGPAGPAEGLMATVAGLRPVRGGALLLGQRDVTADPLTRRQLTHATATRLPSGIAAADLLRLAGCGRAGAPRDVAALLALAALPAGADPGRLTAPEQDTLALAAAVASGAPLLLVSGPFASGTREDHARRRALLTEARHHGVTLLLTGVTARDPLLDHTIEVAG